MKLDIDTTIGWGDKTLAAFAVKVLTIPVILRDKKFLNTDNLAHYTHVPEESYSFDGVEDGWMSKINIASMFNYALMIASV